MIPPFRPIDEKKRLSALRHISILDTPLDERFDRITRLAQKLFRVSYVVMSFVDSDRVWFKSKQGIEASEVPRDISFCGYCILRKGVFCVPNTHHDARFSDNPLVLHGPKIRMYAGRPLRTPEGIPIGVFCIMDTQPRELSANEVEALDELGKWAEDEMNGSKMKEAISKADPSMDAPGQMN